MSTIHQISNKPCVCIVSPAPSVVYPVPLKTLLDNLKQSA